jgi:hypothetical protein
MKTKLFTLLVAMAGVFALGVRAQEVAPSSAAPSTDVASMPQASQIVYAPRLPSANELMGVATAQGLSIDKMVQTASQMTVVYRSANGQTNTVAYLLLPGIGGAAQSVAPAPAPAPVSTVVMGTTTPVVVAAPTAAPQVVYVTPSPAPAYYYDPFYYPSYYAYPWYSPVSVSVGFGYVWGGHSHGGYYGGGYGGHGGHGHH